MRISSAALFDAAHQLTITADRQLSTLHPSDFSGNDGLAIHAAIRREETLLARQLSVARQMHAVAGVLRSHGEAVQFLEDQIDDLIRTADQATQDSPVFGALLQDLRNFGDAIDAACARHIRLLCTPQLPDSRALADYEKFSLDEIHEVLAAQTDLDERFPDARLLPSSDGIVLAFGDIETAPAVATIVPGVGSADPAGWSAYADRARRAAASTGAAVLWIDYHAPDGVPQAAGKAAAITGAERLRSFQAAVANRAARKGNEPELIVVGHSYGSTLVGTAATQGLVADAVVFAGSPGTSAAHAAALDLRTDHPRVIATTADADPIRLLTNSDRGAHGADPADELYGADVWPASGGHGSYWDDPEFYRRLGELARPKVPG